MLKFLLMTGVCMPFCMDEAAGDAGGSGGGGSEASGGDAGGAADIGAGSATADGTGGKAGLFESGGGDAGTGGDGGDGSSGEGGDPGKVDFNSLLGEDLAKNPGFEKYANAENPVQEMAKSLLEAQSKIGQPQVGVPGENATPEERAAFNEALGVPKESAGYGFEKPEGMADEAYDQAHADKWATLLHANNIPGEAANALRTAMFEEHQAGEAAANEALNTKMDAIFGDDKQLIAKEASALMQQAIPDAELRTQIQAAIGDKNTPAFAAALGLVTQHMKKTYGLSDISTGDGGNSAGQSASDLRAQGQKMMGTPQYTDAMHKDHKSTVDKVNQLYKDAAAALDAEAARK